MDQNDDGSGWYARRDGVVRGPFSDTVVSRHILLGRIRLDDELSDDRVTWQAAKSIISLLPDEIRQLSSWTDYQQLVVARLKVDERRQDRRAAAHEGEATPDADRRSGRERRLEDGAHSIARHAYGQNEDSAAGKPRLHRAGVLALTLIAAVLVVIWLLPTTGQV